MTQPDPEPVIITTVKHLRNLLLMVTLTLSATAAVSDPLPDDARPLIILSATDYLGKHTYDQHPYTDLLRMALGELGYTLVVMHNPGLRSLAMANTGVVDGELVRIKDMSEEYPNLIKVPEPLGGADLAIFVAKHKVPASRHWADLQATSVVALRGMAIMEHLPVRFRELSEIRAQNYVQAMHLVIAGRADLAILPASFIEKPEQAALAEKLEALTPVVGRVEGFVHLHKRHAALVGPLAEAMHQLKQQTTAPGPAPVSK
ncbi:ABC transporter substrate-binding protein [Simiduia agarivorans]|uniref:Solute-binding protein family 3/N-terminal domain-containing protein n=1 Tax=Simiduia agarivorans (strain DSM 21679 / JCM 13881 / BCRC 17597 / SA1) TaxID=1117647 RepID=K4KJX4_SIMAS|nr:ABC transporter substrate-binding protein [Simiduia agarivorans]AFU99296.1 hypothetical protein M5M_10585 [Simiduia agarivorans SA1 = DSM 21679]